MDNHSTRIVSFQTVGCRLNQYETERMAAQLRPYGFRRAQKGEPADLYIINTCTVTHRAASDCRYLIRRAARANPEARIVVVGCYVEHEPERIAGMEQVDLIINNSEKEAISEILSRRFPELFNGRIDHRFTGELTDFHERNRAWIKISDGCNQNCSFCIVTIVRGDLVNRPSGEIIDEINRLVHSGYQEVVLTGVNMGYYQYSTASPAIENLADLCRLIIDTTDLYRLRLSSIEPQTLTDELLDIYAASDGRICRHFHLPLQSGSERILRQMRRPYSPQAFLERINQTKAAVPNTIIGADVIVGFPGETEQDFQQTLDLCQSGSIDYLHVFSYSDRPGTAAAEMGEKVKPEIIRQRNKLLTGFSNRALFDSHRRQVGRVLEFISEHKQQGEGFYRAISDNYLRLKLPEGINSGRNIVRARITSANEGYLEGEVLS
ncbi:MAG: tRNA (N(6)-L-threonylcarbamoyladenosine(37)-C(2))-methylthiotransferase MtaB [bacterium]